jgi:TonB family protein
VIDFFVDSQGESTPRLVGSSGNEELDAITLATVKKWQFRPAEQDGKPIDAKTRLRVEFEVQ